MKQFKHFNAGLKHTCIYALFKPNHLEISKCIFAGMLYMNFFIDEFAGLMIQGIHGICSYDSESDETRWIINLFILIFFLGLGQVHH